MTSKRIVAVHLLNDWSGSPLVFRQALEALQQEAFDIRLFTATPAGFGFLSDVPGIAIESITYKRYAIKLFTLWYYLRVQVQLFVRLLFFLQAGDTVYINTLLPFGAALAGWLRRCRVVYHVHEVSIKPRLLKLWLRAVAELTAQQVLFVSNYALRKTALTRPDCRLVYNALPASFSRQASRISVPNIVFPFTVLMICSKRTYKGIYDFVASARILPHIRFLLVLNTGAADVDAFVEATKPPANCLVFSAQTDTIPFYQQAHVILNLSHPDAWIESFGMTILEAMACGRPVIIPPVGGICELIEDGREGFKVSIYQPLRLVQILQELSSDMTMYLRMAQAARQRATFFSAELFRKQVTETFLSEGSTYVPLYKMETSSIIRNKQFVKSSELAH